MKNIIIAVIVLLVDASVSYGGGSANPCTQTPESLARAKVLDKYVNQMTLKLHNFLEENDVNVAVVSRAGSNFSGREFLRPRAYPTYINTHKYSHAGIAVKDPESGSYRFVHLLTNSGCKNDPSLSQIHEQSLKDFFLDDLYKLDVVITVPSLEMQKRISDVTNNRNHYLSLHNPRYSNIANPLNDGRNKKYQNSNMWVLNVLTAAMTGAQTPDEARIAYLKLGYVPSQVIVGLFEGFFGSVTGNFISEDHRGYDGYNFASAASLHIFMEKKMNPIINSTQICLPQGCDKVVADLN